MLTGAKIYLLASVAVWGVLQLGLADSLYPVWYPYFGAWTLAFVSESVLLGLSTLARAPSTRFEATRLACKALRLAIFFFMVAGVQLLGRYDLGATNDEITGLLSQPDSPPVSYGSTENFNDPDEQMKQRRAQLIEKIAASGNWWTYAKSFSIFGKHLWPRNEKFLRVSLLLVGLCLCAERALKVLVPRQLGVVTNLLSEGTGKLDHVQGL
jgi:hypothetical protein